MDEKDFQRIEKLFTRLSEDFDQKLVKQSGSFQRGLGVMTDDVQHKLDLVVEGQQMLAERMDRMEERLDERIDQVEKRLVLTEANLGKKVDAVAADLAAHRADTEVHYGVYGVKESGE